MCSGLLLARFLAQRDLGSRDVTSAGCLNPATYNTLPRFIKGIPYPLGIMKFTKKRKKPSVVTGQMLVRMFNQNSLTTNS